jgi:hypothetical protein
MFIALLKTKHNQVAIEIDDFGEAINTLHNLMERADDIKKAQILETDEYLDDQCPDFNSCRVIVSMGTLK